MKALVFLIDDLRNLLIYLKTSYKWDILFKVVPYFLLLLFFFFAFDKIQSISYLDYLQVHRLWFSNFKGIFYY